MRAIISASRELSNRLCRKLRSMSRRLVRSGRCSRGDMRRGRARSRGRSCPRRRARGCTTWRWASRNRRLTKLVEHAFVEGDLGGLVPLLEPHRGVEAGLVRAVVRGGVVAPCDLVGEQQQQQIVERHVLLLGEHQALGQGLCDAAEPQALERGDELGLSAGVLVAIRRPPSGWRSHACRSAAWGERSAAARS